MNHETGTTSATIDDADDTVLMAQTRSTWPKVIGALGLIYGVMGMLCQVTWNGMAIASDFIPKQFMGGVEIPPVVKIVAGFTVVISLVLGIMLIVGSIGTLRRKRGGPGLIRTWAITRMVFLLIGAILAVFMLPAMVEMGRSQHEYLQNLPADQQGPWTPKGPFDEATAYNQQVVSMAVFTTLMAIVPLTFGLYLSRKKIRDEVHAWV